MSKVTCYLKYVEKRPSVYSSFLIIKVLHALCSVAYKHFYSFVPANLCTLCRISKCQKGDVLLCRISMNFRQNSVLSESKKMHSIYKKSTEQFFDVVKKRRVTEAH